MSLGVGVVVVVRMRMLLAAFAVVGLGVGQFGTATAVETAAADQQLVFVHGTSAEEARQAVAAAGMVPVERWDRIGVVVAAATPTQIAVAKADPGVTQVELDRPLTFDLETSHIATRGREARTLFQRIAAPGTRERPGQGGGSGKPKPGHGSGNGWGHTGPVQPAFAEEIDGRGVTVAVVDSGVDGTHPFFRRADGSSKVVRNLKLACHDIAGAPTGTNCSKAGGDAGWVDPPGNDTDTGSMGGHGTHVAGIAAGVDVTLPDGSELHGAAPGADLVSLSVGQALSIYGGTSGLHWVLQHHADPCGDGSCPPIKVVNNSWGPVGGGNYSPDSATAKLQELLVAEGVVVVWANGNDGGTGSDNRSNPPAQTATGGVLAVANYDDGDVGSRNRGLNGSSSRGRSGDLASYPDLSAPGTDILSSCRPWLAICGPTTDDWGEIGGTSMAAPHVAGIVAQLLQVKPTAIPAEIEDVLEDTAYKFGPADRYEVDLAARNDDDGTSFDAGHGLVDAVGAVSDLLGVDPATVPSPAAECATGSNVVAHDDAGDATTTLGTPHPGGNVPALDVIAAQLDPQLGPDGKQLAFRIDVDDLTTEPPTGTTGEHFDFEFSYAGNSYFVSATNDRTSATGPRFRLGRFTSTGRQNLATLSGGFDVIADTVTVLLPYNAIPDVPAITDGSALGSFAITSRKVMGAVIPNVDSAAGSCPFVVGSGVVNPTPAPEPQPESAPEPEPPTPHATLAEGQTFERDGASPTTNVDHSCTGPGDARCVTYVVKLEPADGTGTLDFSLTAPNPAEDFDIYIHKWPSNEVVASSANVATLGEEGSAQLPAGTYYVVIQPFAAAEGSAFHVRLALH